MADGRKWPWKREGVVSPGSDLSEVSELDLIDVTLLTEVLGEPREVPRLGLSFGERGMTVKKPDGVAYACIPWVSIVELSAGVVGSSRHELPTAVRLEVESKKRRHRFLVPNVQPEALAGSLEAMGERYGRGQLSLGGRGRGARRH